MMTTVHIWIAWCSVNIQCIETKIIWDHKNMGFRWTPCSLIKVRKPMHCNNFGYYWQVYSYRQKKPMKQPNWICFFITSFIWINKLSHRFLKYYHATDIGWILKHLHGAPFSDDNHFSIKLALVYWSIYAIEELERLHGGIHKEWVK